jgi:predicted Zn-dependent protease
LPDIYSTSIEVAMARRAFGQKRLPLPGGAPLVALLLLVSAVSGATQGGSHTVRGTIRVDRHGRVDRQLEVTLMPADAAGRRETYSDLQGDFSFDGIGPGTYTIAVRVPSELPFEDASTRVTIYAAPSPVSHSVDITLKRREAARAAVPRGHTVSADEADKNVPRAARAAFRGGVAAAERGDLEGAVAKLREALVIAPDYFAALNDLGTYLLRLGRVDESAVCLRRAIELGPASFAAHMNLALALFALDDAPGASSEIARALEIDPVSPGALYVSGQIALRLGQRDAAIEKFQLAYAMGGEAVAVAALALGQAYESTGACARAAEAYRVFLTHVQVGEQADYARERLRLLGPCP